MLAGICFFVRETKKSGATMAKFTLSFLPVQEKFFTTSGGL
jgi:hypothetical protein